MGSKRKIINVDEEKCTGCGQCIPNCPEGALQVIDGKARLVSDLFCDGLGACVGHCPEGAMTVEERAAEPYNEAKVMVNIVKAGPNTIAAHLRHLKDHSAMEYYVQALDFLRARGVPPPERAKAKSQKAEAKGQNPEPELACGCPGSAVRELTPSSTRPLESVTPGPLSALRNWPIQLTLMPVTAPYLKGADLLISADCVGSSHPNFHEDLVKGRVLIIACPKLDDADAYIEKLTRMFSESTPKSVTCAHMTVPCCSGLVRIVKQAIADSGRPIPFAEVTIDVDGKKVA